MPRRPPIRSEQQPEDPSWIVEGPSGMRYVTPDLETVDKLLTNLDADHTVDTDELLERRFSLQLEAMIEEPSDA